MQLSLPLSLPDDETFSTFYAGKNDVLLASLQLMLLQEYAGYFYLWSGESGGKSHLLHAACSELSKKGEAVGYVPLDKRNYFNAEVLEGMELLKLVCIDNIDYIAGNEEWEIALFNLYNRIQEQGECKLLITAHSPPRQLNLLLPDLTSRLGWGQIYRLLPLSDEEKLYALQLRANVRGFELSEEVGHFLLKRLDRQLSSLFIIFNQLDQASIRAKRKLTIPFVKEILGI